MTDSEKTLVSSEPPVAHEIEAPSVGKPVSPAGIPPPVPSSSARNDTQRKLLEALKATDYNIERLDRLLSTAYGQERVFAATGYLTHALHHLITSAPWIAVQTRLGLLARLNNRTKSTRNTTAPSSSPQSRLLALSSLMSETRYTIRLLGLVPLWTWGSATLKSPPSDPIIRNLTLAQVAVNMVYQFLENVGYLASKGVISKKWIDRWGGINKWYLWSIRAWFGHIIFQFFVLWRQVALRRRKIASDPAKAQTKEGQEELRAEIRAWKKALVNNVCWAPLCLHWCFENGVGIPNSLSGVISFMAGAWGFYDLWAATAKS
ncbi:uncharacterized protein NFIA_092410 [Aspergillus fischeri NRRL 181]|uniref:25D9-5p n=1 Tax=Neosartorya fischeri (strain ATCC 1020 / DSM 3700 / CBS 544.65 / FGSC A1164 / JCM 1740 / NRRL 181 / WB 181) TaxID=331117 RepID=A1DIS3_NEOFI|nr:conserved hypothetical protein [Aspergillus fischeri NRRL 181]EAW19280.1 conserved hypothetical protein [Aspergillus fischeri NRRL 181]KAG2010911.1 hypothetical protein GB937_007455 [Aspergillus fischeri]